MARTIDQILAEVNASTDPQRKTILSQIASVPQQMEAEEAGLEAKKTKAFDDILAGARRRGMGFSGIPLGEQADYTATEFLPAVARVKQSGQDRVKSLESALNDIGSRNWLTANDIFNNERNFEEDRRRYNENMAFEREKWAQQLAESQRASRASSASSGAFNYGGGGSTSNNQPMSPQDQAYTSVQSFLSRSDREIISDYNATAESARRGNAMDKLKIELYKKNRPDLFSYTKQSGGWSSGIPSF